MVPPEVSTDQPELATGMNGWTLACEALGGAFLCGQILGHGLPWIVPGLPDVLAKACGFQLSRAPYPRRRDLRMDRWQRDSSWQ